MDLERPHRSTSINNSSSSSNATSTTSELFICFTSRLSSSSMKISSKSILSPGRAREPSQISLSSSLTRRLRSNGSMKGGQASPMFPTNGKKRGCAFENPEPSSPKVTCIGQVRVKTKKQGKKFRACRSKRRGEVSFRKVDHTNNANNGSNGLEASSSFHLLSSGSQHHQQQECKKWVNFPVTICEALRAFGAEFNCFLPCRPSCMANQRDKEEKRGSNGSNGNGSSCGAVFARWLVAVQEGEGKGREIELVVGGGEDDDDYDGERRKSSEMMRSSQRRHVFEDIEINDYLGDEEEEEKGRVSICIPPKNALLLMRCRSDPVKMAALANKFLETPLPKDEQEEEEEKEEVQEGAVEVEREEIERQEFSEVSEMFVSCEATEEQEIPEAEAETEAESVLVLRDEAEVNEESSGRSSNEETILECQEQEIERKEEDDRQESTIKEETSPHVSFYLDKLYVKENEGGLEEELLQEDEDEDEDEDENETVSVKAEEEEYKAAVEEEAEEEESTASTVEEKETETTQGRSESECPEMGEPGPESKSKESESQEDLLPDCLLLMMCEPKLSMEVSKETWVCSTDFIRCVPEKKKKKKQQQKPEVKQKDGGDQPKARISIDRNPAPILLHPPRSSCSFPAPPPMATAAKGGGGSGPMAKGYESFVLTRCKSEPRRSSAKLAPDACFWKNRKLEPAALEVGAAGVGF